MSKIVEAIDAEIEGTRARHAEVSAELEDLELRIAKLGILREGAAELNGGVPLRDLEQDSSTEASTDPTPPSPAEEPEPDPQPPTRNRPPETSTAAPVTDEERKGRTSLANERHAKVMAYVREHGEITSGQAAELLGMSGTNASTLLKRLIRQSDLERFQIKPGNPKGGFVYRLNATGSTSDDGPKTAVEKRVVDAVAAAGPIDEGTLAFNASLSLSDCRSVTSGLVRRNVLRKLEEEGVTLFEVAG